MSLSLWSMILPDPAAQSGEKTLDVEFTLGWRACSLSGLPGADEIQPSPFHDAIIPCRQVSHTSHTILHDGLNDHYTSMSTWSNRTQLA